MSATHDIEAVIASPATSTWLRQSLELALQRDCVDAANDAEQLSDLLTRRCSEQMGDNTPRCALPPLGLVHLDLLKNALETASARETNPDAEIFQVLDYVRAARSTVLKAKSC
ncbi:hypothetical protein [Pseudomonas mosselii]|uniref:Uncharacterized protein n=1 Tax=Pseudomonas mosselii TaxID=78327 RepID=A0A7W2JZQ5_9PSED|nr:hypothetical protein [Pseudomonas mosselii]MBA6068097.1 hypothetical protein [Pseudomonas mosselii]